MTKRKALSEAGWLSAESPTALLLDLKQHHGAARTASGRRRLRLFACACCRRVWRLFADEDGRRAVEVAERYADGRAGRDELVAAGHSAEAAVRRAVARGEELTGGTGWDTGRDGPMPPDPLAARRATGAGAAAGAAAGDLAQAAESAAMRSVLAVRSGWGVAEWAAHADEPGAQCALLRDLFGNPFRPPPVLDPTWLTPAVVSLARAAYEERDLPSGHLEPARLAVLADALEEAGCTDQEILGHLRGPGPHARGCWALDAILGKW